MLERTVDGPKNYYDYQRCCGTATDKGKRLLQGREELMADVAAQYGCAICLYEDHTLNFDEIDIEPYLSHERGCCSDESF